MITYPYINGVPLPVVYSFELVEITYQIPLRKGFLSELCVVQIAQLVKRWQFKPEKSRVRLSAWMHFSQCEK